MIYLDNAATTQIFPEVLDAMMPYLREEFGNAGTMYELGRRAAKAVAKAREQVANLINAKPEQIIFTSGGTEANNLAIYGVRQHLIDTGKKHIITSKIEHDSVLKAVNNLCIKDGFGVTYLGVDEAGVVNPHNIQEEITSSTGLASVMYVNNETGSLNNIKGISRICKNKNILFHTDCVQALGCEEIDVEQIGCDFLSMSSHKIHGAKGVGALYVRDKSLISPIIYGGINQEFGLRGGTENVAGIVGFGEACEIAQKEFYKNRMKIMKLRREFCGVLKQELSGYGLRNILHINGESALYNYGKIVNLRFDGIDGQTLLLMLGLCDICVSAGSACRSNESEPSHVLTAMGLTDEDARNSIRVSFSSSQTLEEIKGAAAVIANCVNAIYQIQKGEMQNDR